MKQPCKYEGMRCFDQGEGNALILVMSTAEDSQQMQGVGNGTNGRPYTYVWYMLTSTPENAISYMESRKYTELSIREAAQRMSPRPLVTKRIF